MLQVVPHDVPINLDTDEKFYIDLFSLRVLSLLICRGEVREKAGYLMDIVMMKDREKEKSKKNNSKSTKKIKFVVEEKLEYANNRLIRALKLLVYFSVVLPGAFMSYYKNEELYQDVIFNNEHYLDKKRDSKKAKKFIAEFQ